MSEKCRNDDNKHNNNNSDNHLTSCRTDGGRNDVSSIPNLPIQKCASKILDIYWAYQLKIATKQLDSVGWGCTEPMV